jgi:serine/threonine protein kinase
MGEVYRVRDTKLDRDVAIKVLPESFAADADRVAKAQTAGVTSPITLLLNWRGGAR